MYQPGRMFVPVRLVCGNRAAGAITMFFMLKHCGTVFPPLSFKFDFIAKLADFIAHDWFYKH